MQSNVNSKGNARRLKVNAKRSVRRPKRKRFLMVVKASNVHAAPRNARS